MSDSASDRLFREGKYEEAATQLRVGLKDQGENGSDQLLYLLDLGLSLHAAGKYEESNKAFFEADKIAEIKDYTSLAAESASLLTSDNLRDYKGEDFEKVLINTYLAINYALMGDHENALVEARRVNRKLQLMVSEGQRKYKQNAFARYLSAILYEADGNWNDAYVDYKLTYDLTPAYPGLGKDLYRLAWLTGDRDDMDKWTETFKLSAEDQAQAKSLYSKQTGKSKVEPSEIIVIYENGISPVKRPDPGFGSIPRFYARYNPVYAAKIEVRKLEATLAPPAVPLPVPASAAASTDSPVAVADTYRLHDIESTATENLQEKWGGILAKKLAGVVAKQVLSKQVENVTHSPLLGALANIALYASDQADVRSWNLLPRDLQIARIQVAPGSYTVRALPQGAGALPEKTIQVGPGKKAFVDFRYTPR
ncbi:MAG: hypothetical protein H7222_13415 [Methylotenera sp.]|nr:hypothetical protein [Oligoflexia bacterium]